MASHKEEANYSTNRNVDTKQKNGAVKANKIIAKEDPYSSSFKELASMREHRPSIDSSNAETK